MPQGHDVKKSPHPNYDSLGVVAKRRVDAKVMNTVGARSVPRGVRVYQRDPRDIDLFRELYAIEDKARKLQTALEDVAADNATRQKRFDIAKAKAQRQMGSFIDKIKVFNSPIPPKRRERAANALETNRII